MSTMQFDLPPNFSTRSDVRLLKLLGYDRIPLDVQFRFQERKMLVERKTRESCYIVCPLDIPSLGRFMLQSGFLMTREEPYRLTSELARGEIKKLFQFIHDKDPENQFFNSSLLEQSNDSMKKLGQSLHTDDNDLADELAVDSLKLCLDVGERLQLQWAKKQLEESKRHEDASATCLGIALDTHADASCLKLFDANIFQFLNIPVSWKEVSPKQNEWNWDWLDERIDLAIEIGTPFTVGPIIDFSGFHFPDWAYSCQLDAKNLAQQILLFVEKCVQRYSSKVNSWEIFSRSNSCPIPSFKDEQLLWLTRSGLQITNENDPNSEFVITIDQPWGSYVNWNSRAYSPISFVDTLVRSDAPHCSINLQFDFGMQGGSYCRNIFEFARRLDEIATLDIPIRLRVQFPSASSELTKWGWWRGPFSQKLQEEWTKRMLNICLARPYIESITWGSMIDSPNRPGGVFDTATSINLESLSAQNSVKLQQFPFSGLFDDLGNPKLAMHSFRMARSQWLSNQAG